MTSSPRIILTGASRGLGLAILRLLLTRHNARVATLSRSFPSELKAVQEQHTDRVLVIQGDVGVPADNRKVIQEAVTKWEGIDGLVLNASSLEPLERIERLDLTATDAYVRANLLSILYMVQPALPYLRRQDGTSLGRIVMVSSGASTKGYSAWGLYSMVKSGMNSLARTLASEEGGNGIGVWAVRPGLIDTGMQELLRGAGSKNMDPQDVQMFQMAFDEGQLLFPERPGGVIAGLVVGGTMETSGEYVDLEDPRLSPFNLV